MTNTDMQNVFAIRSRVLVDSRAVLNEACAIEPPDLSNMR